MCSVKIVNENIKKKKLNKFFLVHSYRASVDYCDSKVMK